MRFKLCLCASVALLLLAISLPAQTISQSLNANWQFSESGKNEWLSATVPGTVHTDLLAHGKIPDPSIGTNEEKVQWVETKTWEYKTTFDASPEIWKSKHKELIFEGLDTYAKVYLNDSLILTGEDMFAIYRIDVNKYLKQKENIIRIVFLPASELIEKNKSQLVYKNLPGGDRVFIRKAQYQFGWDFGPRLVTAGIWKPVRLEGHGEFRIEQYLIRTDSIRNDTAFLTFKGYSANTPAAKMMITVKMDGKPISYTQRSVKNENGFNYSIRIAHPKLWWCNGMGKPVLHDFEFTFTSGKETITEFLRTGIRTIQLDQTFGGDNTSFTFILNGEPVFIKGANWLPADNFLPRVTPEKYYSLIKPAQQSNMNMLRVWGGGIYESDDFYNDCDSLGIMVWQDFTYACAVYPMLSSNTGFTDAMTNIKRLRFHPSLSLWCGNNENEEGWNNWGWQKEFGFSERDSANVWNMSQQNFLNLFPKLVDDFCKDVPYITTSPATGWGHPEAYKSGDVHYWGVWWGMEPFSSYDNHVGRFVSEYGFQSVPAVSSLSKFDDSGLMDKNDPVMKAHEKHPKGFETIDEYMKRDYPAANGISDYSYISQVMQRDGISRAIEDHRRAMPYCMGTMYWQYNDCWPGITWSTTDYYGQKKLLQYAIKDLYAPVLASAVERNDSILIYVINDDTISHKGLLAFAWTDLNGNTARTSFTPTTIYTGRSMMVLGFQKKEFFDKLPADSGVLRLVFNYENNQFVQSLHYFSNTKSLKLAKDPGLVTDITPSVEKPGTFTITLRTVSLAKNVYLSLPDASATFTDNGFDMLPGETKDVVITTSLSEADLKAQLKIQTMNAFVK